MEFVVTVGIASDSVRLCAMILRAVIKLRSNVSRIRSITVGELRGFTPSFFWDIITKLVFAEQTYIILMLLCS